MSIEVNTRESGAPEDLTISTATADAAKLPRRATVKSSGSAGTMNQLQYRKVGGPEVLRWARAAIPVPASGEILVRVRAASLNPTDRKKRTGELRIMHLFSRPPYGMGLDVAGDVVAIGAGVDSVSVGDRILGTSKHGDAFADYTVLNASKALPIPDSMTYSQAACIPLAGAASVSVVEGMAAKRGQSVFVNGGGGGIGLFVVQQLALAGVSVTASGSAASLDHLRQLGATRALDYRGLDLTSMSGTFDTVLDTSGTMTFASAKQLLKAKGTYRTMTPTVLDIRAQVLTLFSTRRARVMFASSPTRAAQRILELVGKHALVVQVGLERALTDAIPTISAVEDGTLKAVGKIVLTA